MVESSRSYPKVGNGEVASFPEKHVAMVGKGSTQEVMTYGGNPMAKTTGGAQENRVRNIYAKNATGIVVQPTPEQITPPVDQSGPAIDSSAPAIVPF